MTVMARGDWNTNAEMLVDVARLGYLPAEDDESKLVLDPTYGLGRWWTLYRPKNLAYSDANPARSHMGDAADFRQLPWPNCTFDTVAFDPPYKLNGTPTEDGMDWAYGVDERASWQSRHQLIRDGITECLRVTKRRGYLLVKCQDQVCSGQVRWQTIEFTNHAGEHGAKLVDSFLFPGYREQPPGRRQVHARRNYSTLLVFRKG